jgi:hypothetical protein
MSRRFLRAFLTVAVLLFLAGGSRPSYADTQKKSNGKSSSSSRPIRPVLDLQAAVAPGHPSHERVLKRQPDGDTRARPDQSGIRAVSGVHEGRHPMQAERATGQ